MEREQSQLKAELPAENIDRPSEAEMPPVEIGSADVHELDPMVARVEAPAEERYEIDSRDIIAEGPIGEVDSRLFRPRPERSGGGRCP